MTVLVRPTTSRSYRRAAIESGVFLGAIFAANWLTSRYGFVWVAPGLKATAGTFAAGVTFTVRDAIQDRLGRWFVIVLILAGAGLSALVSPSLAVASGVAFLVSETCDFAVYTPLRSRSWDAAVWCSNIVGATVDTLLFLWIAFGAAALTMQSVSGQMVGKMEATLVVWLILRRWR